MTDAGSSSSQPNVSALVEALDQRARQAGSDAATTVLRGMLGSLAEALGSIEARLDRIEENLDGAGTGGGGASAAVVEQVQAGIAAFNTRLGRLEEAFVQAVEDSGSGTESVVEQFRRSVEEAIRGHVPPPVDLSSIDRRLADLSARLESIPQPSTMEPVDLGSLERRLDEVAARLSTPAPALEPVDLSPLERRLEQLGGPIDLSPLERRLDELVGRIDSLPAPEPAAPPTDISPLERRLDDLGARIDALPASSAAPEAVDLEPIGRQLDDLRERVEAISDRADPMPRLHQRLDELEQRIQSAPVTDLGPVLADIAALRGELANLANADDNGEQLRRLDENVSALKTTVDQLPQSSAATTSGAADVVPAVERVNEQLRARVASLLSAQSAEVQRSVQQVDDQLAVHTTQLDELKVQLEQRPTMQDLRDAFTDAVRREAELITQRVASLTMLVESTRALLDEHVDDTSNSLGRKASEVGRRLAADFGLRGKKPNRPDPRELGRGGH